MSEDEKPRKKHEDTRISAYLHSLEEVLEKAFQLRPPNGKKQQGKGNGSKRLESTC